VSVKVSLPADEGRLLYKGRTAIKDTQKTPEGQPLYIDKSRREVKNCLMLVAVGQDKKVQDTFF